MFMFSLGVPLRVGLSAASPRPSLRPALLWAFRYYPSRKCSHVKEGCKLQVLGVSLFLNAFSDGQKKHPTRNSNQKVFKQGEQNGDDKGQ